MSGNRLRLRHLFGGGFATDFGPSADVRPNQAGDVLLPYLVEPTENVYFELDGGPHKIGGTSLLNSSPIASSANIRGLFDFWRQGVLYSPTQKRVVYASTAIYADAANGTFSSIKTGLEDSKVPCFTVFNDALIMSSDSTVDVPLTYDGTTVTNLGGSPPQFAFSCVHKNHVWAAGVAAAPSTLYYSANLTAADWTTSTSGSISIDPGDGDRITGLASHKDNLWVFKGPYKGSIHRITGSTNTGSDSFGRITFINGIGAVGHNTIFKFRDDLGFMWHDGTVHSLAATAAYGDFNESALSRPIHKYIKDHVTTAYLNKAWAATDVSRNMVIFTLPFDSSTIPNRVLMMDYSRAQVWWAPWPALDGFCVARVIDASQSNRPIIMLGGSDGYVRKTDAASRATDAVGTGPPNTDGQTAIAATATTPFINYGEPAMMKTLAAASVGIAPKGNYDIQFGWTRDNNAQQTDTVNQGGGDVLGVASANQFTLDTSALAGSQYVDRFFDLTEGGEFRSVSYQVYNGGLSEDLEVHSIFVALEPGAESLENS